MSNYLQESPRLQISAWIKLVNTAHHIRLAYAECALKFWRDCQQLWRGLHQGDSDQMWQDVACEGMLEQLLIS